MEENVNVLEENTTSQDAETNQEESNVNGTETARYSLAEDAEIRLESENGGYNILVIKNGKADITEASCPDHVCVDQRAISKTGEAITCLPNKTVITIDSKEEAEIDFVS